MTRLRRLAAAFLAIGLVMAPATACGDDKGEDQIGDNQINDPGD
jgi:hypothetical protein